MKTLKKLIKNDIRFDFINKEIEAEKNIAKSIKNDIMKKGESKKQKKIHKVMAEFKNGTLKTSNGQTVTDRKQAIAIGISESKRLKKSLTITFNLDILKAYAQSEATIKFKSDNPTARIEQLKLNDVKEQLKHWYKEQDEHSRKLVKKFKKQDLSKHPPAIVEKLDNGKYIILDGHHHLKAAIKQGLETYPAYVSKGYAKDMDSFGKNNSK